MLFTQENANFDTHEKVKTVVYSGEKYFWHNIDI